MLNTGWGTVEGHPVTSATRFDLASVTKLFTATAFLSFVSAGKVGLDDPLVSIVPEFAALSPRPLDGGHDPHSKLRLPTRLTVSARALTQPASHSATSSPTRPG